jgi:hypothetical protein
VVSGCRSLGDLFAHLLHVPFRIRDTLLQVRQPREERTVVLAGAPPAGLKLAPSAAAAQRWLAASPDTLRSPRGRAELAIGGEDERAVKSWGPVLPARGLPCRSWTPTSYPSHASQVNPAMANELTLAEAEAILTGLADQFSVTADAPRPPSHHCPEPRPTREWCDLVVAASCLTKTCWPCASCSRTPTCLSPLRPPRAACCVGADGGAGTRQGLNRRGVTRWACRTLAPLPALAHLGNSPRIPVVLFVARTSGVPKKSRC